MGTPIWWLYRRIALLYKITPAIMTGVIFMLF